MRKSLPKALALVFALCTVITLLAACTPAEPESPYAFEFTGSGVAQNGREFTFTMTGSKEDNTLEVVANENKAIRVTGRYELIDGKGYKLYVNDTSGANGYARYNPDTKEFTAKLAIAIGNYGSVPITFTYCDASFDYDGVGITEQDPPLFANVVTIGSAVGDSTSGAITCTIDGTFSATAVTSGGWIEARTGTYEYDEANNKYLFTFNDEAFYTFNTYDPDMWRVNDHKTEAFGETIHEVCPNREILASSEYNYFNLTYEAVWDEANGYYWFEYPSIWRFNNNMGWIVDCFATFTPAE